ncbi:hypothetical protein [Marinomonas shanghaiensis]|jgi:hypothetical protein|uniref:hypothetical protein n=1 Tax=Marinomonas shanghaiensis TaxID=2202418 RepID=UPI003A901102
MWTLLLWLNAKIVDAHVVFKKRRTEQKRRRQIRDFHLKSQHMPEYLKRDIGLPPYSEHDS